MKLLASAFVAMLALSGCQSAYYAAWEKVGVEKRDILVDRVETRKNHKKTLKSSLIRRWRHSARPLRSMAVSLKMFTID